jgi:hypothetical protein
MRALLALIVTGAVALTAGIVGFQAGVASNVAAAGGVVWLGGGFPGLGFLFFLMFVAFLVLAFSGRRHAWHHGRMAGPGGWGHDGDARGRWVADVHRRLHEEEAAAATGAARDGRDTTVAG